MDNPKSIADVLDAAADLISKPGAWTQSAYAREADGSARSDGRVPEAVCWCMVGALEKTSGRFVEDDLARFLYSVTSSESVVTWNDAVGRTQSEAVNALREAAALARAEGK